MSIAAIANQLNASSPQSFHRTVRTMMGMSAAQFRRTFTGASMLDCYRARLVRPYSERLRSFDPLTELIAGVRSPGLREESSTPREGAEQGRAA